MQIYVLCKMLDILMGPQQHVYVEAVHSTKWQESEVLMSPLLLTEKQRGVSSEH